MNKLFTIGITSALALAACSGGQKDKHNTEQNDSSEAHAHHGHDHHHGMATDEGVVHYEDETHLKNVKQYTFGGDNAEAYWSNDGKSVVFQVNNEDWGLECDQIYKFDIADGPMHEAPQLISTGKGRTTCSYFMPGDSTIIYSSTHQGDEACPPVPEKTSDAYVWPIYEDFDIYIADLEGNIVKKLISGPGYDAEPTVSPKGDKIVFTSIRSGDLELYTCDIDGSNIKQITSDLGYDGGAFFSPDGTKLIFRASRPTSEEEVEKYKRLLAQGQVEPTNMELFVCNVDGTGLRQITELGNANWAPFFHPSGEKVIFSSNHATKRGFPFNLYMINLDGTGLEQITHDGIFDAFPMFSPDGSKLIWSSNRNNGGTRATNIFIADWVE